MEYSFTGLHKTTSSAEFLQHHGKVVDYHSPYNETRQTCHNYARGIHHNEEALAVYKRKRKKAVTFRGELAPMRTVIGQFIQSKYDMKPAPVEPSDQATADPLIHMHHWTADNASTSMKDIGTFKEAYVGGSAYQESYVEIIHGKQPRICVVNQNPFSCYWDPDSRDLINREDAEFWDRETFLSYQDLLDRFPEQAQLIKDALAGAEEKEKQGYEKTSLHADRSHEKATQRNGKYKVVERFYKVRKAYQFGIPGPGHDGARVDIGEDADPDTLTSFKQDYPKHQMRSYPVEYMYYAAACESVSTEKFLMNEPYHWQPRNPKTGKIMWTLVEVVAESLGGESTGFIEAEIGPLDVINAMMANILHSAKHSVSNSMFIDPEAFDNEDRIKDVEQNASDGDRRFRVKKGYLKNGAAAIAAGLPQTSVNQDHKDALTFSGQMLEETSSAPKASRGMTENSGTPAAQTEMRIQQAFVQLMGLITNWKHFLAKRSMLWYAMWREFFPYEMQIRVTQKTTPDAPDFMTINEPIGIDAQGNVVRANNINSAVFDITFEESVQSPTAKDSIRGSLVQLMNMAGQLDPVMAAWLVKKIMEQTNLPQEDKNFLAQHMQVIQQDQQQKAQAEQQKSQLDSHGQMQNLAQAEAEQTALPPAIQPGPPQAQDQALQTA